MSSRSYSALATVALAAFTFACGGGEAPAAPSARAEKGAIERIVVATGTIEPAVEVEVRPRIPGIVERILVKDGDRVERGQVLVEIERELLASQEAEARAELDSARVEARYAGIELARAEQLIASGALSSQQLDEAKARVERSRANVARAEARLATLSTQLGYASVRSPLAGRVLDVPVEEGSAVSPVTAVTGGTLLLSLAATDRLHLEGLVDENEVARIAVGQEARIRTEAYAGRVFAGRVREIAPLGKRVQNVTYFEVKLDIVDTAAALLKPRMSGDADIVIEQIADALLVPETALHYRGDEIYVEAPNGDGSLVQRVVKIGIGDGKRVQVLEGLAAGDEVRLP